MPQNTPKVGDPIRPRLPDEYLPAKGGKLTHSQARQARGVLKRLRRTDTKKQPQGASGRIIIPGKGMVTVTVDGETITVGDKRRRVPGESLGARIAEGVYRGYFTQNEDMEDRHEGSQSEQERSGGAEGESQSGSDDSDTEGDGQGQGESQGSDDTEGDGDGDAEDGDTEGDAEDEQDSQSESQEQDNDSQSESDLQRLMRRLWEIDDYATGEGNELPWGGDQADRQSNVPFKMGARMLAAGIPVEAVLHATVINWPESARSAVEVEAYDPSTFGGPRKPGQHPFYHYVRAMIEANVPIYVKGPTQAGKSFVLEQVAKDMGLTYRACPMVPGASPSWLLGTWVPRPDDPFIEAGFIEVYRDGGIFCFEEMDAASPDLIVVLNNALSNGFFENPRTGEKIPRHPNFRVAGNGNTWGLGADANFVGRSRQDKAVLERFRPGRIELGYDRELQRFIAETEYENAAGGSGLSVPEGTDGNGNLAELVRGIVREEIAR